MSAVPSPQGPLALDSIAALANGARYVLDQYRVQMLAPDSKKVAPVFNTARLGDLTGMTAQQIDYRGRTGTFPSGTLSATGGRREYSLQEVRTWTRAVRANKMRPAGADGLVLALANFKGGVSKSTSAVTLAQGLSLRGHRVLVVDLDAQGTATILCGVVPYEDVDELQTVLPLCLPEEDADALSTIDERLIRPTYWDGVDLVPANIKLYNAELVLPARQARDPEFQFWNVLNLALEDARFNYDVIVLDTAPSLSYLTMNALMAADGIVMPLPPVALDYASSVEFWGMFHDLAADLEHRAGGKSYEFVDVLLSKVDSAATSTEGMREVIRAAYGTMLLPIEIPMTSTAANASVEYGTVYDMRAGAASPKTIKRALDAYERMTETIESQINMAWSRRVAQQPRGA